MIDLNTLDLVKAGGLVLCLLFAVRYLNNKLEAREARDLERSDKDRAERAARAEQDRMDCAARAAKCEGDHHDAINRIQSLEDRAHATSISVVDALRLNAKALDKLASTNMNVIVEKTPVDGNRVIPRTPRNSP